MSNTTIRFRTSLILSAMLAVFTLTAVAESATRPQAQSFFGVCNLKGTRQISERFIFVHNETIVLKGTCSGRVNGDDTMSIRKTRMEARGTTSMIGARDHGTGYMKLAGLHGRLEFDWLRTAGRAFELLGSSGRALGVVSSADEAYRVHLVTPEEFRGR